MSSLNRIFETLSYRVDKEIKESLYINDVFLSTRWSFFERNIVHWSTNYKKYILLSLVLAALVASNLVLWQPWVKPYISQYLPNWRNLLEWQGVFLSGQLTIVGVVYPLVIGLISVLFQNKSAKKVIFPIYQKYSGFMFAGLSGLTLSGFIVAGYFLRSALNDSIYVAICLTSAFWLFSNLLLTFWFFGKTFRMLDENSREGIIFRFSIHEACEADVRKRIKHVLLDNSISYGITSNPDKKVLEVLNYDYTSNDLKEITRIVKRGKSLKDVKFWLLNIAIWLQISILKLKRVKGGKLIIQHQRTSRTSNIMSIAKYNGFEISSLAKILIKFSFSFEKGIAQEKVGLSTVLNGFVGPANDAMRDGNTREFSEAVDNLVLWHAEIAEVLSFENDDGKLDNWLLLPAGGAWGRNHLDELLSEYYRLAREAVERIPDNSRFYVEMLYLHKRIFTSRDTLIKKELRSLIQGSYYMWYLLVEWRSYNSESSDMRIANKYEDILYNFVGAWESWLMHIEHRSKRNVDSRKIYHAFATHLEFTASTAISALRFNNFEAAGWGVDMLINWPENISRDTHSNAQYRWRSELINHCLLSLEPNSTTWQVILKNNEYDYKSAFNLAFKNAHIDLRVLTACYMLLKPGSSQSDLLIKYVKALLSGSRIHPTGGIGRSRNSIRSTGDLLGSYIRQRDYGNHGDGTYSRWLSSILESFGRIYEERKVSGRIYSGWGANDTQSMDRAYVEIGISMSKEKWSLPNEWAEAISSNAFSHAAQESIKFDLRNWLKIANEDHNFILVSSENLETLKANFVVSIEEVIQKLGEAQDQAVVAANIDEERLKRLGVTSSSIFGAHGSPEFPLVLFERLNHDAEVEEGCVHAINIGYGKERVALGIDANRAINEDTWVADIISNDLKLNLLRELLRFTPSASYKYTDTDKILSDILNLSDSMEDPALFVGNQLLSNVLYSSSYERELAERHDISLHDGLGNEYICHIGRCEVYTLGFDDVDFCLLTSKELFDTVKFRKIADGQFVDVSFELTEGSETDGNLVLKYWMKVGLIENTSCIKLELSTPEDDIKN
ncbi:MAG: hypothetical protein ACI9FB_004436 [Candidatus Azotimanducaceae bacterium]|jgi:hypothetical protein